MAATNTPREEQQASSLSLSEAQFRLLVESARDYAIFMLDPRGIVSTWNAGAERMVGYPCDEVLGKHASIFHRAEEIQSGKCDVDLERAAMDGRVEYEGWRVRKDGSHFWAKIVITAVRDQDGKLLGYAQVVLDMTERRQVDEERIRLAEANRIKDEFLATVSHELRTPLTAILGWAHILKDRVSEPTLVKGVETIRRNAAAQARLIEDILDVSRIITGKLRLELKPVDLSAIARDAIDVVRHAADAKRIGITFEHPKDPALLVGDPTRLQQISWNLLSNAVKFTEPGGAIDVRVNRVGPTVTLQVHDTGHGIDPEFLPHLFERFRQEDASTTRKFGGLGLGLAIVRHIVELHGGKVTVESAGPGRGATFTVELPVRAVALWVPSDSDPPPMTPPSRAPEPARADRLTGVRVLVVDDELDARDLLETVLVGEAAQVFIAASAQEGRALLERARPDVIVSDIGMPEEDGYDFIRSVRKLSRAEGGATPAIALTAYVRSEDRLRALDAGFTNYLAKPVDAEELIRVLRNTVDITASTA